MPWARANWGSRATASSSFATAPSLSPRSRWSVASSYSWFGVDIAASPVGMKIQGVRIILANSPWNDHRASANWVSSYRVCSKSHRWLGNRHVVVGTAMPPIHTPKALPSTAQGRRNLVQRNTPLITEECEGQVTVTDPCHPLYGRTLKLSGLARLPGHVRHCQVEVL